MYTPKWLFLFPGLSLMFLAFIGYVLAMPAVQIGRVIFDVHTLVYSSLAAMVGYQAVLFAILTKTYAMNEGLMPRDPKIIKFFELINLERGILLGLTAVFAGCCLLGWVLLTWRSADFGRLNYAETLRWAIPGATLAALGFQTVFSGFFVSILGMKKK